MNFDRKIIIFPNGDKAPYRWVAVDPVASIPLDQQSPHDPLDHRPQGHKPTSTIPLAARLRDTAVIVACAPFVLAMIVCHFIVSLLMSLSTDPTTTRSEPAKTWDGVTRK